MTKGEAIAFALWIAWGVTAGVWSVLNGREGNALVFAFGVVFALTLALARERK